MKAQSSLETLLLMAGILAFFVAVIPFVNKAADATTLVAEKTFHQAELEKVTAAANEAGAFGPGNSFDVTITMKTPGLLTIGNGEAKLFLEEKNLTVKSNVTVKASARVILPKGKTKLTAANDEGEISVKAQG